MQSIIQGFVEAMRLLFTGDPSTYEIAVRSLLVSGVALLFALVVGVPIGSVLALTKFPGRRFLVATVNTGMGVPPVVVGLIVALFLWRTGPLGGLHLMYTVQAMVIAQVLIALPIVAGLSWRRCSSWMTASESRSWRSAPGDFGCSCSLSARSVCR